MGGRGSGRKPKYKKGNVVDFKPEVKEVKPKGRVYSVSAHVKMIKTSSGCRFEG